MKNPFFKKNNPILKSHFTTFLPTALRWWKSAACAEIEILRWKGEQFIISFFDISKLQISKISRDQNKNELLEHPIFEKQRKSISKAKNTSLTNTMFTAGFQQK